MGESGSSPAERSEKAGEGGVGSAREHDHDLDTTICRSREIDARALKSRSAALVVLDGKEIGSQFLLDRGVHTIGRAVEAEIPLRTDPRVSRFHARLDLTLEEGWSEPRCVLTDLGSTNQTYVNGIAVGECVLADRDTIQIGDTTLRFAVLDEVDERFHRTIQDRLRFDTLTSLLTREYCELELESHMQRCRQRGAPLSVLMMDIDFFRSVNEAHGHQGGSAVLAQLGLLLEKQLAGYELVARFGGEEFLIGLPGRDRVAALNIAEGLRSAIEEHRFHWAGRTIAITACLGVAQAPDDAGTLVQLIARADEALYWCKHSGRNQVRAWAVSMSGPDREDECSLGDRSAA